MKSYSISQRKKSRGNPTWYGRTFEDGVLLSEVSLKTRRKADAQAWLDAMNAARFLPETLRKALEPNDADISKAADKFIENCESIHGSTSTYRMYTSVLRHFVGWCTGRGIRTFRKFTQLAVNDYISAVTEEHSAVSGALAYIKCTNRFCRWAADMYDMAGFDPFKKAKTPKAVKREKPFWTLEEIDRILDAVGDDRAELRLFFALMAFAGLRHAEAASFGPECLDSDGRLHIIGKGNKEAFLPISERLLKEMSRCHLETGMFNKEFYRSSHLNDTLRDIVCDAGLPRANVNCHRFRHSFASNLFRSRDVKPKEVQQLMRHSSISITMDTYTHLIQDDLTTAVNAGTRKAPAEKPEPDDTKD